jgi:predicted AlkP superfamily phosphohydrolase/phosphomutase
MVCGLWVAGGLAAHNRLPAGSWWRLALVAVLAYGIVWAAVWVVVALFVAPAERAAGRRFGFPRSAAWSLLAAAAVPLAADGPLSRVAAPISGNDGSLTAIRGVAALTLFLVALLVLRRVDAATAGLYRSGRIWAVVGLLSVFGAIAFDVVAQAVHRADVEQRARFPHAVGGQRPGGPQVVLVGVDGASWRYVAAMLERGELPNLASLATRGAAGPLRTVKPTLSAVIWPTITTGTSHQRHGVTDFFSYVLPGVGEPLMVPLEARFGLRPLLALGVRAGVVRRLPATSNNCHAPRIWDIVAATGGHAATVGWWATWPAQPDAGIVVSDVFVDIAHPRSDVLPAGTVAPKHLAGELAALVARNVDVSNDEIRQFWPATDEESDAMRRGQGPDELTRHFLDAYTRDRTVENLAVELMHNPGRLDLLAVYLRGLDTVSHLALRFGTPDHTNQPGSLYSGVVEEYYRYVDRAVARLAAASDPDSVIVLVSDHGFDEERPGSFGHDDAPDGLLVAAGGPFAPGSVPGGATIYDVFPTMLQVLGLAVPSEGPGRVLSELFSGELPADVPERAVATYGLRPQRRSVSDLPASWSADRSVERLKALGYLTDG